MPYRITLPGGIRVEADTEHELAVVLRVAQQQDPSKLPPAPGDPAPKAPRPKPTLGQLASFFGALPLRQQEILRIIATSAGATSDEALVDRLDLKGNNQLGGVMAGISKNALRFGFDLTHVLDRRTVQGPQGRRYLYTASEPLRMLIQQQALP